MFASIESADAPSLAADARVTRERLPDCWRVTARCSHGAAGRGAGAGLVRWQGLQVEPLEVTYFLSRETIIPRRGARG